MTTADITLNEIAIRLGEAVLCGIVLGLNREVRSKKAGVRTQGLVSLGAALATVVAVVVAGPSDGASVTRVIQGIVAGVGFLGAGVILKGEDNQTVHGLTTAAVTWFSACLGIACGAGLATTALVSVALALLLLVAGGPFEKWVHSKFAPDGSVPELPP